MRIPTIWCSQPSTWLFFLLFILVAPALAAPINSRLGCDTGQPLTLHSIAKNYSDDLLLTPEIDTRQSSRRTLRVGVVIDANTPFVVNRDDNSIEGIVADYLKIISDSSQLSFQMIGYCDYGLVLNALENGQIDLMAGTPMLAQPGLIASHAFFTNRHVEVRSKDWDPTQRRHPETVAIVNNEPLSPEFLFNYHNDNIVAYPNQLQGLLAVAYGNADVFVANATSANYLIDQLQLLTLQIRNFAPYHPAPYSFLAKASNQKLIDDLNVVLELLPSRATGDIQQRWFGSRHHYNIDAKMLLTEQEIDWIHSHPIVTYLAPLDLAPIIFRDRRTGKMAGLSVELINLIARRTGLKFEPVFITNTGEGLQDFRAGKIDMLPGVAVRDGLYNDALFSTPFSQSLWGILVREDRTDINNVADLAGKRVGLQAGSVSNNIISNPFLNQKINFIEAPDTMTLVRWLQQGKVDAILKNMMTANFIASQDFKPNIKIVAVASEEPLGMAFAIRPEVPELKAIIDKVLDSIAPEDLDSIISEWSVYKPKPVYASDDSIESQWLMLLLKISSAVLLLCGLYLGYLVFNKRRQASQLHTRLLQQESIINALPFAVFIRTADGQLATYNRYFAADREDELKDLLNQNGDNADWPLITPLDRQIDDLCQQVLQDMQPQMLDISIEIGGELRDIFLWIIPLNSAEKGLLGGWLDISQRKNIERQLEAARLEAESANRAKSTFLATISHELRTPMYAILGLLELEIRGQQPVQKETLKTVSNSAQSLLRLLDDIIDSAKIEAGQLSVHPVATDFRAEFERLLQIYQPIASERQLRFSSWIDDQIPPLLLVDMLRVKQVVGNLLGNALKFTEQGGVSIDVTWETTAPQQGIISIDITDTGIGISDTAQASLFQPFSQANEGGSPRFGGSGLGLWICRQLVMKMGGDISMESELGKGTSLFITLPLTLAELTPVATDNPPRLSAMPQQVSHLNILVVDDMEVNRKVLRQQLAFIGLKQVVAANDGAQAWALLQEQTFDLVITDYNMPVMNGFELTYRIRNDERLSHIIVIGCTADARQESVLQCQKAGMDTCLIKPVTLDSLRMILAQQGFITAQVPTELMQAAEDTRAMHSKLRQLSGGNAGVEKELLASLLSSNQLDLARLQQIMTQLSDNPLERETDYKEIANLIHRIKGGVQFVAAEDLVASCILFEDLLSSRNHHAITEHWPIWQALLIQTNEQIAKAAAR
ncbi:ATP-binding protein [Yersinia sp. J1]|uniref:ATP-binding protein n=1 Tax=Yersinia sp. J1 TaxID=3424774 RepID=UPI003D36197C